MVLKLFGFIFQIISSILSFWLIEARLDGPVTFGSFILASFVIIFVISKFFGSVSHELNDSEDESYEKFKKEFSSKMSYKSKH